MEFLASNILTPYNYSEWKLMILLHFRSKYLYWIVMGIETKPMSKDEKFNWFNKSDMDYGRLCIYISWYYVSDNRN